MWWIVGGLGLAGFFGLAYYYGWLELFLDLLVVILDAVVEVLACLGDSSD